MYDEYMGERALNIVIKYAMLRDLFVRSYIEQSSPLNASLYVSFIYVRGCVHSDMSPCYVAFE